MNEKKESKIRIWLAQQPALKLFIKIFLDILKFDFKQSYYSLEAFCLTVKANAGNLFNKKENVECNFCGWKGNYFYPHLTTAGTRLNEKCPVCHSIPRYRSLMKFLKTEVNIFDTPLKILEVGPNRSLQNMLLEKQNIDYVSIDIKSPQAMFKMDVTDLKFADETFDFIFCISVMQYVEDDKKGFAELNRVLKKEGRIIFFSGIDETKDFTVTFPKREAANNFTVRTYGWDIKDKISEAGFSMELFNPYNESSKEEQEKFGLGTHSIFLLRK
ncbi:MAG: hypothetical protein CR986_07900 [Ignavibacteriae bacterium]|nr:MAG: hypothetical protein CR986_07900 [Ignavibacteriota bacterium]